jgi:dTDP-glucose 4,6-dehydratase
MRKLLNILVTGGCGFIGCNFIRLLLKKIPEFTGRIINLDSLSYAGNQFSLMDIETKFGGTRYFFEKKDINDTDLTGSILKKYRIDTIVHFAAESHVDRSILGPETFIKTNVLGTFNLLESARQFWTSNGTIQQDVLFHHISTDEVYGSLGKEGFFTETTPYDPRSPYSASKAASDHLAMAYYHTYGLPVTLSNCSNNYGPYQFPEKFIPLSILNMLKGKTIPVYGDGKNIRDWIFVDDHNFALWTILKKGKTGEKYNIGGDNEKENIYLLYALIDIVSRKSGISKDIISKTVQFIKDRPGHDRRYAIDCSKIKKELGWGQIVPFDRGLENTVTWYLANKKWTENILSGEYKNWIKQNYEERDSKKGNGES